MSIQARTPAEEEAFKHIEKDADPFGDNEDLIPESIEAAAEKAAAELDDDDDITGNVAGDASGEEGEAAENEQAASTEKEDAAAPTADEAAAALAEMTPEPAALPATPKAFEVPGDDFDAKRKELQTQRKDIIKQWGNGELSDEQYAAKLDELDGQIYTVIQQQAKQQTLAEINEQNKREAQSRQQNAENAAMVAVAKASKDAGQIDYSTDQAACGQFDALHAAAKLDPSNAGLSASQLAQKAHDALLVLRGITKSKAEPTDRTPPARQPAASPPITLRGLPNASTSNAGGTVADALGRLTGDAYELAYAKLTAEQKAALLD